MKKKPFVPGEVVIWSGSRARFLSSEIKNGLELCAIELLEDCTEIVGSRSYSEWAAGERIIVRPSELKRVRSVKPR